MIKFRAMKRMKGMSLYVDDKYVEPESGGAMSAETVQWIMLAVAAVLVGFLVYALTQG